MPRFAVSIVFTGQDNFVIDEPGVTTADEAVARAVERFNAGDEPDYCGSEWHSIIRVGSVTDLDAGEEVLSSTPLVCTAGSVPCITLHVDCDEHNECPNDCGGWRLISFGRRHRVYENPGRYLPPDIGLRRRLKVGTAFWLSYFEHSDCVWSLVDEGPDCPWDSVRIAGLLLWARKPRELAVDYSARKESARQFCTEYTSWCNGWVYCFSLENENGEFVDGCGGYCDFACMLEAVRDSVRENELHFPVRVVGAVADFDHTRLGLPLAEDG